MNKICDNCGQENHAQANVCGLCGEPLGGSVSQSPSNVQSGYPQQNQYGGTPAYMPSPPQSPTPLSLVQNTPQTTQLAPMTNTPPSYFPPSTSLSSNPVTDLFASWNQQLSGVLPVGDKNWMTTLLFSIFLGIFGVDRFYLGYAVQGGLKVLALLVAVGAYFWVMPGMYLRLLFATRFNPFSAVVMFIPHMIIAAIWLVDLIRIAIKSLKPIGGHNYI